MRNVWVLLTAMPPTVGHGALIQFALEYSVASDAEVHIILTTQPQEPFVDRRRQAVESFVRSYPFQEKVKFHHFNKSIAQDPATPGFRDMWRNIFLDYGAQPGDGYVSSENYGKWLAEILEGKFVPFDPYREIYPVKATNVREDLLGHWDEILPEFQATLTTNVVIFGAESTGKTTLSKALAERLNGRFIFEYARPYLETVENVITPESMTDIWEGQAALQTMDFALNGVKPFVFFDTDLFSTLGYWQFPHWKESLGEPPVGLQADALMFSSELYIVTKSDIPFEEDPLRYGGDKREGSDEYWIDVLDWYSQNYVVLDAPPEDRLDAAVEIVLDYFNKKTEALRTYDRGGF